MADMMDKLANKTISSKNDYIPVFSNKNIEAMLNNDPTDGWDNIDYMKRT
jgi:hypothetical protein